MKYLAHLVRRLPGNNCHVFENSEIKEFERGEDELLVVHTDEHRITCRSVVIATDVPLTGIGNLAGATILQTKIAAYTSYAVGAKVPRDVLPVAEFWDVNDPYFYLRVDRQRDGDYAIFGGLDHKTGQEDRSRRSFDELEKMLGNFAPHAQVNSRWSGQVIESYDGLPLIGETAEGQFVATGFSGNGLTFGTLSAMMICDAIVGRKNPWTELFDPNRKRPRGGAWDYVRENLDYPYYMVKDRLRSAQGNSVESVKPGEGKVLKLDGKRVAVYRDPKGTATLLSPVCTHMGCIVHWNDTEASWDCPCHGSRFRCKGEVLAGPAETPLESIERQ